MSPLGILLTRTYSLKQDVFQYSGGIKLVERELLIHCWGKHFNEKGKRHEQEGGTADMPCWRALNSSRRAQDLAPQRNGGGRKEREGGKGGT